MGAGYPTGLVLCLLLLNLPPDIWEKVVLSCVGTVSAYTAAKKDFMLASAYLKFTDNSMKGVLRRTSVHCLPRFTEDSSHVDFSALFADTSMKVVLK